MKEQLKQLIKELEDRSQQFAEFSEYEINETGYWSGREDEVKTVIKMLKVILNPWEELPYDNQGDDGDLLPA